MDGQWRRAQPEDIADIEKALAIESGLSGKTIDYLESLGRRVLDENVALSDGQRERLDEILKERGLK